MHRRQFLLAILLLSWMLSHPAWGGDGEETNSHSPASYFLIGNSLTWDTVPSHLDGDVQWHVDCGKSLPYIYAHPDQPCVKSSKLWPQSLSEKQYDYLSVQPHYGSTLSEDTATISKWIEMQPDAIIIIHSGWARSAQRAEEIANDEFSAADADGKLVHCSDYFDRLVERLEAKHPDREFRQTRATDVLDKVARDIQSQAATFDRIEDLYRDAIHMKIDTGRYLMHNVMRIQMDQPISDQHYRQLTPEVKAYLDSVLKWYQEQ